MRRATDAQLQQRRQSAQAARHGEKIVEYRETPKKGSQMCDNCKNFLWLRTPAKPSNGAGMSVQTVNGHRLSEGVARSWRRSTVEGGSDKPPSQGWSVTSPVRLLHRITNGCRLVPRCAAGMPREQFCSDAVLIDCLERSRLGRSYVSTHPQN